MAVLTPASAIVRYQTGDADMVALIGLRNVTTGDTLDVATVTMPAYQVIQRGVVMGVSDFVEIAASFTGTVVTLPGGPSHSSAYLLIWGS